MKKILIILALTVAIGGTITVFIKHKETQRQKQIDEAYKKEMEENKRVTERIKSQAEKDKKESLKLDFSNF